MNGGIKPQLFDTDVYTNTGSFQKMSIRIEPIPYEKQYLEGTLQLLRGSDPDHPEVGDRELFEWQICERYLTLFQGRVVGYIARIPQVFWHKGTSVEIGFGATLVLDMSNFTVKTFAGSALLDKLLDNSSLKYAAVGIVPEIEQSYTRRGYAIDRDSLRMFARFFVPLNTLKYMRKSPYLALPVKILNCLRPIAKKILSGKIEQIDRFDSEWDETWRKILSEQYEFYGDRPASFLNYKLSQPRKSYFSYIHRNQKEEVDGYVVYRNSFHNVKNLKLVRICDLVGIESAKTDLLSHAVKFAVDSGVDGIVAISSNRDRKIYRRCGLWISKKYPIVLDPQIRAQAHITFFDSDLDNLW